MNWDAPFDKSPWSMEDEKRFDAAIEDLLERILFELGDEIEIVDSEPRVTLDDTAVCYVMRAKMGLPIECALS